MDNSPSFPSQAWEGQGRVERIYFNPAWVVSQIEYKR